MALLASVGAGTAHAQDEGTVPRGEVTLPTTPPVEPTAEGEVAPEPVVAVTSPLVVVPSGCVEPDRPDVVFVGSLVERDYRTGRFEVIQVRAGDIASFQVGSLVDVRYGVDAEYLDQGEDYLVAARQEPVLGILVSTVREPVPDFGGDDVIGVAESDVECPVLEDQVRTVRPDGTPVESGVFTPFLEKKTQLLGAFLVPTGIAFAVVFVLAMLRVSVSGVVTGVSNAASRRVR
jgi:hypothetical protein